MSHLEQVRAIRNEGPGVHHNCCQSILVPFARERGLPIRFYSAETLRALTGDFTVSDFVRSVTGVDSVCERAAMVGA